MKIGLNTHRLWLALGFLLILGLIPAMTQAPSAEAQAVASAAQEGLENNTNRRGADYRAFDLPQAEPSLCRNECANDPTCKAFTYVKPAAPGAKAHCRLKTDVPNAVADSCCVSGVKKGGVTEGALEVNADRRGGDYRDYDLREADPNQCRRDCENDPRCRAFTYMRPSFWGSNAHCFLKESVPPVVQDSCCLSGVKADTEGLENNTNRRGADYRDYDLAQADPAICRNDCANDPTCKAFTYVKPAAPGAKAHCWLKSDVPSAVADSCCVSGVKKGGVTEGALEVNTNRRGGDYRSYEIKEASPNPSQCRRDCENDPKCRAFTYSRPTTQGAFARCWLKDRVPPAVADTCCLSGVKSGGGATTADNKDSGNKETGNKESGGGKVYEVNWDTYPSLPHLNLRGKVGQRASFKCPPNGKPEYIWGTDIYTDDSRVCLAAVHAGLITFASGGEVTIEMLPGQKNYRGTERHGVTSSDYNSPTDYYTSYRFAGAGRLNNVAGSSQQAAQSGEGRPASNSTSPASASPTNVIGLQQRAPGAGKTIKLRLFLKDSEGEGVGGAWVNVWHDTWSIFPDTLSPADYQRDLSHVSGLVEFDVLAGKSSEVYVEVGKGDLSWRGNIELAGSEVSRVIKLANRSDATGGSTADDTELITIKVHVGAEGAKPEEKGHLEGARVLFYGEGERLPRYEKTTDRDGNVTILVTPNLYTIEASKEGYRSGSTKVRVDTFYRGKTFTAPTINLREKTAEERKADEKAAGANVAVTVNVVNAVSGLAVDEAKVWLIGQAGITSGVYTELTDPRGNAKLTVKESGRFDVVVSKATYEEYKGEVRIRYGETNNIDLGTILLKETARTTRLKEKLKEKDEKKAASSHHVYAQVFAGDKKGAPIEGASVKVGNTTLRTDAEGKVAVPTSFGIDEYVVVTAGAEGYQSKSQTVKVNRGARYSTGSASATFTLQPGEDPLTEDTPFKLLVQVLNSSDDTPIDGASVSFFTESGKQVTAGPARTTKEGVLLEGSGNPPNSVLRKGIRLTVTATGYQKQENILVPGIDLDPNLLKPSNEPARFTVFLNPVVAENTPINLVVEVREAGSGNKAVGGANVQVLFNGKPIWSAPSNPANGKVSFIIPDAPATPLTRLRGGLTVAVSESGYQPKSVEITPSQLKPSKEAVSVPVVLERDWSALTRLIVELEGKAAAWHNDYAEVGTRINSLSTKAQQLALAEKRAATLLSEIEGSSVKSDVTNYCQEAGGLVKLMEFTYQEARQKEQEFYKQLKNASTLAASCSGAGDAAAVRKGYQSAIQLIGQIGDVERRAALMTRDREKAAREIERLKTTTLFEVEERGRRIDVEARAAEEIMKQAEADFTRASQLRPGLSSGQKVLQGELYRLQLDYDIQPSTNSREGLPAELPKRLNNITGLLHPQALPTLTPQPLQDAGNSAANINRRKAEADKLLAEYKSAFCDTKPKNDELEGIGQALTNATFELGLAADLPKRADECAKGSVCRTSLSDLRSLFEQDELETAKVKIDEARAGGCDVTEATRELEYFRDVRRYANLLAHSMNNCRFQEALNLAQQIPPDKKSRPLVVRALIVVEQGLKVQRRIAALRESARQAVARGQKATAADPFITEAELIAADYPCLVEEARRFKEDYPEPRVMGQSETKENESEVSVIEKPEEPNRPRRKVIEVPENENVAAAPARPRNRRGVIPVPESSAEADSRPRRGVIPVPEEESRPRREDSRPRRGVIPVPESDDRPTSAGNTQPAPEPQPAAPPAAAASGEQWVLESVTVDPATKSGWTYNSSSPSVSMDYGGIKGAFQWTPPPQQFDRNGFSITLNVQCTPANPENNVGCILGVRSGGLESNIPAPDWNARAESNKGPASASKSISLKPRSGASDFEIYIGVNYNIGFSYRYRRVN